MQIIEVSIVGVRAAVVTLSRDESELRFRLFPMAHLGRANFYREISTYLSDCDLIVAEGRDEASSTGLGYLLAARLTRQEGSAGLVHQNIDYASIGVATVWPDGPPKARSRIGGRLRISRLEWIWVYVLAAFEVVRMTIGGRETLLRGFKDINDDSRPRLFSRFLTRLLIHDRDQELLHSLREVHDAHKDEPITVAVVYGAGHMPAVIQELFDSFDYRPADASWLTIIDFTESPAEDAGWHLE